MSKRNHPHSACGGLLPRTGTQGYSCRFPSGQTDHTIGRLMSTFEEMLGTTGMGVVYEPGGVEKGDTTS